LRHACQNLAILALALSIGAGSRADDPAEPDGPSTVARPPATTPSVGSGAGRAAVAATGPLRFEPLGLSSLRPHVTGRIPVVLVHGLWGGPRLWEPMVKALEADPCIRGRFQFLTFAYSGRGSIPHTAFLLRRELRSRRNRLDPDRSDPSWDRMVLIGHSMGGLLCKMMAQDSGSKLWDLVTDRPIAKLAGPAQALERLKEEMVYKPLPEVRRLIFIATPHRGSPADREWIRAVASHFVHPSDGLRQSYASLLAANGPDAFRPAFRAGLPTSIDQLVWENPLLLAIDALPIEPGIERHSIIANLRRAPGPDWGDGLVPYASAHVPGATSEFVVTAGHICLANPDVIGEVARILKVQATHCDPPIRVLEADERSREMSQTTALVESRLGLAARPGTKGAIVPARD
jgi:pimeloyl-ACP methyl ester carboxylesterase